MERTSRILVLVTAAAAFALGCARSHARISEPPDPVEAGLDGVDGGRDAWIPPLPDAGPPCLPGPEMCDGRDQDCDARLDESAVCALPSAEAACVEGACRVERCSEGVGDCDALAANGCEQALDTREHCGGCGIACGLTEACVEGRCERERVLDITVGFAPCALLESGRVLCWGRNFEGHVGDGTLRTALTPTAVVGIADAVRISSDGATTCALHGAGAVSCWGEGHYGQRGDGTFELVGPEPAQVVGLPTCVDVEVGLQHACALTVAGEVWCWGRGTGLVDGLLEDRSTAAQVAGLPPIAHLFGGDVPVVRAADGRVFGWFSNEAALPGADDTLLPQELELLSGAEWVRAGSLGCAVFSGGNLYCWGRLPNDEWFEQRRFAPVPGFGPVTSVITRAVFIVALTTDGQVMTWGGNDATAEGLASSTPRVVPGASGVRSFGIGYRVMCVLMGENQIRCMGANEYGAVGDGTTEPRTSLVPVVGFE